MRDLKRPENDLCKTSETKSPLREKEKEKSVAEIISRIGTWIKHSREARKKVFPANQESYSSHFLSSINENKVENLGEKMNYWTVS